ncbi:MAG: response regulator [Phycisphaerales bacterium]
MATQTILLVDDEAHITHVMARAVRAAGFEVVTAEDGEEAYELAVEHRPALVVTDLQMPYMSGIDLAGKMLENAEMRSIPIILLTARGYVVSEEADKMENIQMVVEKPFSAKGVLANILELLGLDASGGSQAA